jgi:hypothetical protein
MGKIHAYFSLRIKELKKLLSGKIRGVSSEY